MMTAFLVQLIFSVCFFQSRPPRNGFQNRLSVPLTLRIVHAVVSLMPHMFRMNRKLLQLSSGILGYRNAYWQVLSIAFSTDDSIYSVGHALIQGTALSGLIPQYDGFPRSRYSLWLLAHPCE